MIFNLPYDTSDHALLIIPILIDLKKQGQTYRAPQYSPDSNSCIPTVSTFPYTFNIHTQTHINSIPSCLNITEWTSNSPSLLTPSYLIVCPNSPWPRRFIQYIKLSKTKKHVNWLSVLCLTSSGIIWFQLKPISTSQTGPSSIIPRL